MPTTGAGGRGNSQGEETMFGRRNVLFAVASILFVGWLSSCSPTAFQRATTLELGTGLGVFQVTAGEPARNTGTQMGDPVEINLGSGSIELDPGVITVTPTPTTEGKARAAMHVVSTMTVTVWIGTVDQLPTVCEEGEQYGPFTVGLDENNIPEEIDPSRVTLSDRTLDLLNGGDFSLCIEVVSPVTGTVTIESLTFNLGL
jgi:hypothetical protein